MKVTRIYSDKKGETHFEDLDLSPRSTESDDIRVQVAVSTLIMRVTGEGLRQGWHCSPCRQFVVLLDGEVQVEVSDGEVRLFTAGEIILAEDLSGKGHNTMVLSHGKRRSLFIPLE
jgi:hypothetical protein